MPRYKVAHLREQGQDVIIVPLEGSFGRKSPNDQGAILNELQLRANSAGLKGRIVPVWDRGRGQLSFLAPEQWHPFFQRLNLAYVVANLNRELTW